MAGSRQRSLVLVPTTLVISDGHKPPMTSKAAKKAYQEANRTPRVSRAEQRRRDAAEIKRLNEEHAREKAAAKAKAARDKKAEKAKLEKAARKKSGLPEPSRYVRPSQSNISVFVRNGNKRSWQAMEDVTEQSVKIEKSASPAPAILEDLTEQMKGVSEDEFGYHPPSAQSSLALTIDSALASFKKDLFPHSPRAHPLLTVPKENDIPAIDWQPAETSIQVYDDTNDFGEFPSTQLLCEVADRLCKYQDGEQSLPTVDCAFAGTNRPKNNSPPVKRASAALYTSNLCAQKLEDMTKTPCTVLQERSTNMLPPPRPRPLLVASRFPVSAPIAPGYNYQARKSMPPRREVSTKLLPSSTQAFIEHNLEDFFPSPTQELRELDDDPHTVLPQNHPQDRGPLCRNRAMYDSNEDSDKEENDPFLNLICTQDLTISSQDLLEITTPSRARPTTKYSSNPSYLAGFPDLPSAQSEQPYIPQNPTPLPPAQRPSIHTHPSPQDRHPKRPFFEEKEQDLFYAAIHESKVLAAQKALFEQDQNENYKSKQSSAGAQRIEEGKRRVLQRVQSTATDYGDDEFRGCSQELLALC